MPAVDGGGRVRLAASSTSRVPSVDSAQPQFAVPRRVIRGGSFLFADTCCMRYRPAAWRPQMVGTGMSHIGFRCIDTTPSPPM